jgi:hypothetical protein
MIRLGSLALLLAACSQNELPKVAPKPAPTSLEQGPKEVVLTIKAAPGQLVETPQGLWVKAHLGTKAHPLELQDGPASIAELGFARSWVDHPACPEAISVRSKELVGGDRWIDRVEVRCKDKWFGELYFDLTVVVERQLEALRGAENPRARLGLESESD